MSTRLGLEDRSISRKTGLRLDNQSREKFDKNLGRARCYRSSGWLIVLVINGHRFEVFRLKYLVTIQAADIVNPIAPRQDLGSGVLANLHK
jgi:hypothetical protein